MSNTATALAALITALVSGAIAAFSAYKSHQSEKHSASAEAIDAESRARQALASDLRLGLKDCRDECYQLREQLTEAENRVRALEAQVAQLTRERDFFKNGGQSA